MLFFIPVSGFLFTCTATLRLMSSRLYRNLSFDSNERKTGPFDYQGTLGVGYRESACVWCEALLWDIILFPLPLVFTAESEAGQVQRCAAPRCIMEKYRGISVLPVHPFIVIMLYLTKLLHFGVRCLIKAIIAHFLQPILFAVRICWAADKLTKESFQTQNNAHKNLFYCFLLVLKIHIVCLHR